MQLPRFRLRTLMIAVAVVGLAIAIGRETVRLRGLSHYYRQKASVHAKEAAGFRRLASSCAEESARVIMDARSWRKGHPPDHLYVCYARSPVAQRIYTREFCEDSAKDAEGVARWES